MKSILPLVVISVRPAWAYVDPGSGQLVWQLLQAAMVGSLFFVGKAFTWVRTALKKPNRSSNKTSK
jgi:hypothetical protein